MTTRPSTSSLSPAFARPCQGRLAGNVAVPETKLSPREATCRKDFVIA